MCRCLQQSDLLKTQLLLLGLHWLHTEYRGKESQLKTGLTFYALFAHVVVAPMRDLQCFHVSLKFSSIFPMVNKFTITLKIVAHKFRSEIRDGQSRRWTAVPVT